VPETAVRLADKSEKVWVASPVKNGSPAAGRNGQSGTHVLKPVSVDIVEVTGENAVVQAGAERLAEGDLVLVMPLGMERDGVAVNVEQAAKTTQERQTDEL
jgi:hypothetical protein